MTCLIHEKIQMEDMAGKKVGSARWRENQGWMKELWKALEKMGAWGNSRSSPFKEFAFLWFLE